MISLYKGSKGGSTILLPPELPSAQFENEGPWPQAAFAMPIQSNQRLTNEFSWRQMRKFRQMAQRPLFELYPSNR
jgi:hypothetical protein